MQKHFKNLSNKIKTFSSKITTIRDDDTGVQSIETRDLLTEIEHP